MGYVVRPKPTAAMLEYEGVGYRSGIRPFSGLAVSQKKRKVRSWSSRRKGSRLGFGVGGRAVSSLSSSASPTPPTTRSMRAAISATPTVEGCVDIVILQGAVAPAEGCASRRKEDGRVWPFFFTLRR